MFQIRLHGRGGQGVVTAAELLSIAAFIEGKHSQAFPSFGSERMGAPVMAFCRFSDRPIRLREPVMTPNCLIIQDPTLLSQADLFAGLSLTGFVLINSHKNIDELPLQHLPAGFDRSHLCEVPATELALKHVKRPLPNAALLGGFAALTGQLKFESLKAAIMEKFPGAVGEANSAAARAAYDTIAAALAGTSKTLAGATRHPTGKDVVHA